MQKMDGVKMSSLKIEGCPFYKNKKIAKKNNVQKKNEKIIM